VGEGDEGSGARGDEHGILVSEHGTSSPVSGHSVSKSLDVLKRRFLRGSPPLALL
jgi:hypothetical protein